MEPYAASLFAAEPRLWDIHTAAQRLAPGDWHGWERIKDRLRPLVGWYADDAPPALRTTAAWDAACQALLDAWELRDAAREEAA